MFARRLATAVCPLPLITRRTMSTLYDETVMNLAIHKGTKVICQGFTGKQVRKLIGGDARELSILLRLLNMEP